MLWHWCCTRWRWRQRRCARAWRGRGGGGGAGRRRQQQQQQRGQRGSAASAAAPGSAAALPAQRAWRQKGAPLGAPQGVALLLLVGAVGLLLVLVPVGQRQRQRQRLRPRQRPARWSARRLGVLQALLLTRTVQLALLQPLRALQRRQQQLL